MGHGLLSSLLFSALPDAHPSSPVLGLLCLCPATVSTLRLWSSQDHHPQPCLSKGLWENSVVSVWGGFCSYLITVPKGNYLVPRMAESVSICVWAGVWVLKRLQRLSCKGASPEERATCEEEHSLLPVAQHTAAAQTIPTAPLGCAKPQVCDRIFEPTDWPSSCTTLRYAGRRTDMGSREQSEWWPHRAELRNSPGSKTSPQAWVP